MATTLIRMGDTQGRDTGYGPLNKDLEMMRIIGVELRANWEGYQEELEMLACNILVPNVRMYPMYSLRMPCTLHTTVGDFAMSVGCQCANAGVRVQ